MIMEDDIIKKSLPKKEDRFGKFFREIEAWNAINTRERENLKKFLELGRKIDVHYLSMASLAELRDFCDKTLTIAEREYFKRCEGYG